MDLGETGIGKKRALFVGTIRGRDIATTRVGREIKHVAVSTRREHDSIGDELVDPASAQITSDNSLGVTIDHDKIEHLRLRKHSHRSSGDLAAECLVTT